jgi:transcriptional regulator with XRE-family HTH domain
MTPSQIRSRRMELGLTVAELAGLLNLTERELDSIECGDCRPYMSEAFQEVFAVLEERLFATYAGA